MAFTTTVNNNGTTEFIGRLKYVDGTFTNTGGSTGGEVVVPLRRVRYFGLNKTGAAVDVSQYAVNETMPLEGNSVTIVTTADVSGVWFAIGE